MLRTEDISLQDNDEQKLGVLERRSHRLCKRENDEGKIWKKRLMEQINLASNANTGEELEHWRPMLWRISIN